MRLASALVALGLCAAVPATAQTIPPAPQAEPESPAQANPYRNLFTGWDGANRESVDAELRTQEQAPPPSQDNHIPAYSPLAPRSQADAVALGERVGAVVRAGNCAEGERMARAAGDFALVRAVREHCARRD
jgi:hypothetical protein